MAFLDGKPTGMGIGTAFLLKSGDGPQIVLEQTGMVMRIITEEDQRGRWTAWFDGKPAEASQGENAAYAVRHLMEFAGCAGSVLFADFKRCTDSHREFILDGILCRECRGSGRYVGLTQIEDCRQCGGSGVLDAEQEEGAC